MINSTSSQQGTPSTPVVGLGATNVVRRASFGATDSLSTAGAELLKANLASEPEVRPEMVAKGRALAADPNYPSAQINSAVARTILLSPDLSEDQS